MADLRGIAPAIAACWRPPHEGDAVTLKLSFRRDGTLIGRPRITYSATVGGADGQADLASSIYAAVARCTPLKLTAQLGAAIAGRVFLIRFVAPRREQYATADVAHERVVCLETDIVGFRSGSKARVAVAPED